MQQGVDFLRLPPIFDDYADYGDSGFRFSQCDSLLFFQSRQQAGKAAAVSPISKAPGTDPKRIPRAHGYAK
ncbi:MAG: hypothetical protein DBX58_04430 [Clostridiales bacterium]|nr:MAG: hypothetical protein DBX58_04430 [Clostridiales bacterium]